MSGRASGSAAVECRWRHHNPGVDASVAHAEVERIRRAQGGLCSASHLLSEASDAESVLHGCFEWDDGVAAHEYRLTQARHLLRSIVVLEEGEPAPVYYVHVEVEDREGYVPAREALRAIETREQVISKALGELRAWLDRYSYLANLAGVRRSVDALRRQVERAARRRDGGAEAR